MTVYFGPYSDQVDRHEDPTASAAAECILLPVPYLLGPTFNIKDITEERCVGHPFAYSVLTFCCGEKTQTISNTKENITILKHTRVIIYVGTSRVEQTGTFL